MYVHNSIYWLNFLFIPLQIHLEPINMGDKGMQLPCQFYDMPGIDKNETIKREDIEKIVNGTIKLDVNVSTKITLIFIPKILKSICSLKI